MRTSIVGYRVLLGGILILVGQGCRPPALPGSKVAEPHGNNATSAAVASSMGFGKLPSLTPPNVSQPTEPPASSVARTPMATGETEGISADSKAMAAPATAPSASPSSIVRPIPPPPPKPRPLTVEYLLEGDLPGWGSTGDVLLAKRPLPDAGTIRSLASQSGLPKEVTGGITTVTMANFQWHDADGFTWTYDAANRSASFWKEIPIKESERGKKPPFDEAAVMKAADAFMDAHGFSEIRKKGGVIQDIPQFHPLMKGGGTDSSMPCITNDAVRPEVGSPRLGLAPSGVGTASPGIAPPAGAPDGDSGKIRAEPETAIYPSPCWWPIQATVSYPGEREGRKLADSYGNDVNVSNIAIDLQTGQVANGFVQLDENAERSSYPLIDRETAKRRLQSGGRNPVWPWGNETGNIEVHLKTIELVWMRYDVWNNGTNDTYYLPAIRGLGTVLRGKGMEPEEYRTIIPLLADDVFEDVTPPGPEPLPLGGDAQMLQAPGKR